MAHVVQLGVQWAGSLVRTGVVQRQFGEALLVVGAEYIDVVLTTKLVPTRYGVCGEDGHAARRIEQHVVTVVCHHPRVLAKGHVQAGARFNVDRVAREPRPTRGGRAAHQLTVVVLIPACTCAEAPLAN